MAVKLTFSEYFELDVIVLEEYGALDISIDSDLPLFIDPFLLFASDKVEYQKLHNEIVAHLINLKEIAVSNQAINEKLFQFPEIKQNWLGLCKFGNQGRGLGPKFAKNIILAFSGFYSNFGDETVSESSHIEKLTLVGKGIGKDFISDFTTNLIFEYLLEYTEKFAQTHLKGGQIKEFSIRCKFNAKLGIWTPRKFMLPYFYHDGGDFFLLTPVDILTKDEAFISNSDLTNSFTQITNSLDNASLRASVNNYFSKLLPSGPSKKDFEAAVAATIKKFPAILDYYIKIKEGERDKASKISIQRVNEIRDELIAPLRALCQIAEEAGEFIGALPSSYSEALERANFLKDVIENNDGYRVFYHKGKPIAKEDTVQRIFRLTWFASDYDVNAEVNNGRGPADYKISKGANDSTIVEFKLARSSSLKANLLNQTEIYKKASKSISDIKVILCYTASEITKVKKILESIKQVGAENIVIIDGSPKQSASTVR